MQALLLAVSTAGLILLSPAPVATQTSSCCCGTSCSCTNCTCDSGGCGTCCSSQCCTQQVQKDCCALCCK
ncbi:MAG: hypothetical protein JSS51_04290 [Planctomycetes bacterium]|nr:hypothetical protein [Planctomycetota bacterium]